VIGSLSEAFSTEEGAERQQVILRYSLAIDRDRWEDRDVPPTLLARADEAIE
jgi:hypothetical protein